MNAPRSLVFALFAALAAPASTLAGDGCVCGSEAIDCINQGGSQYDCALMWLKNPCWEPGHCWDAGGINIGFAGNGVGGGPGVPIPPNEFLLVPFKAADGDGDIVPCHQVASSFAMAGSPAAGGGGFVELPVICDPDAGTYTIEVLPGSVDPAAIVVLQLILVMADGSTHLGAAVLVPDCPGDLNFDGVCNSADLNILLGSFGDGPGGDLDLDGDTDSTDLNILLSQFGSNCLPPV